MINEIKSEQRNKTDGFINWRKNLEGQYGFQKENQEKVENTMESILNGNILM